MIKQGRDRSGQDGFALMYMAVALTLFCLVTGLAVDSGRAYVVKAQLTKAVDGAALAAARNLNTGNPRGEAAKIFSANFPAGYFGTSSVTPDRRPRVLQHPRDRRDGRQRRHCHRVGRVADDVHAARRLQPGHRHQLG